LTLSRTLHLHRMRFGARDRNTFSLLGWRYQAPSQWDAGTIPGIPSTFFVINVFWRNGS
jgi:hypothetical protein